MINEQGVEFFSVFDQHFFPKNKPFLTFLLNAFSYSGFAPSEKCRFVLIQLVNF